MPKRSSKKRDVNQMAADILSRATGQPLMLNADGKNAAAVALGRLGGLKGGRIRANRLSAKKRAEIAKRAAAARWNKSTP